MDAKEFWAGVREEETKLKVAIAKGAEGQPDVDEGVCFIVSRKSRAKGINAGSVTLATHRLAAQRIVEETHELATSAQIEAYCATRQKEADSIRARDLSRKAQVVMHVDEKMRPIQPAVEENMPRGRR